ncbi:rhomboid family protein [Lachnoclostridium phytofermentans]|uniref:Peptidase S54 rhomboid domain-containing protein n=1 Tax=Lachnoclostridium phytofermentans (strain ATCC 700394 / DSM 18823 / ISDg) TaxID=357809 RepID=A9KPI5_LACP7|nr:membrane protein [Lachnoclostridium phytofermentans]ABX43259.1 conserved hypothetical protein [Lachnoclostridium phytofermentans ISDg]
MKFLNKIERKFGKYAIHNLMNYVIGLYVVGFIITLINPYLKTYLSLDIDKVLQGQVWRLVTFLIQVPSINGFNLFFFLIQMYLYYWIGSSLERSWGAFRFNLYFFSGILFNILATVIIYAVTGSSVQYGLTYINQAMFFAFAALYPNVELLLMFVLPIKVKYLGYFYAIVYGYEVFLIVRAGGTGVFEGIAMVLAILNFLIFFFATRNYRRISPKEYKRRANYKRQVRKAHNPDNVIQFQGRTTVTRHKCAVCGRTELDDESLEFRFCSKCDGNYEYCMDHLYTHEHVHREDREQDS